MAAQTYNFATLDKYRGMFSDNTELSGFVTKENGVVATYKKALNGKVLPEARVCDEGCVVAIKPERPQDIADETFWYAVVLRNVEGTGTVRVRWLSSAKYLCMSVHRRLTLIENRDELASQIEDFSVPREEPAQYMTNVEDTIAYSSIHCVLTVKEFNSLRFDPRIEVQWDGGFCSLY